MTPTAEHRRHGQFAIQPRRTDSQQADGECDSLDQPRNGPGLGASQLVRQVGQPGLLVNVPTVRRVDAAGGQPQDPAGQDIEPTADLLAKKVPGSGQQAEDDDRDRRSQDAGHVNPP
jgi:hypothetical protein